MALAGLPHSLYPLYPLHPPATSCKRLHASCTLGSSCGLGAGNVRSLAAPGLLLCHDPAASLRPRNFFSMSVSDSRCGKTRPSRLDGLTSAWAMPILRSRFSEIANVSSPSPLLACLALPFSEGQLVWPDQPVLFLRARSGWEQTGLPAAQLLCQQSFKPQAAALQLAGHQLIDFAGLDGQKFPLVMVLPPRSRDEARALFAQAVRCLPPGGCLLAAQANNEGARSGEQDLAQLLGNTQVLSKHKCRVYWAHHDANQLNPALLEHWLSLDAPRPIADGRYLSRPGLFAWDRLDAASQLLVAHLPTDLAGRGADLGAGFGYLAAEVAARCAQASALDLYEAEARALELAHHNLAPYQGRVALGFHWHDVAQGLLPGLRYDFMVSNPPFHQGRRDEPALGQAFIRAAAAALKPEGRLWLVANRHLPYEEALRVHFRRHREVVASQGFKVIEAVR